MDFQRSDGTTTPGFVPTERVVGALPPVTGAWRETDPAGSRRFVSLGPFEFERGGALPVVRTAYETAGELNADKSNAVLLFHPLTADAHFLGPASGAHPTSGWLEDLVGPGRAIDTDRFFVLCMNALGGCQGTTGPASMSPRGTEWGTRFPYTTIRDQADAVWRACAALGITRFALVLGGSLGGMQALEFAILHPTAVDRLAVIAAPAAVTADAIAQNSLQIDAIRLDPNWHGGEYYDERPGYGPHRGLALARKLAMVSYRSPHELSDRFARTPQSAVDPYGGTGRFAVESYLDFHGNRFTRRFDANSYITLAGAMTSHDVGRGRGGAKEALAALEMPALTVAVSSDRLFAPTETHALAELLPASVTGDRALEIDSPYGHDGFLVDSELYADAVANLLDAAGR